MTEGGGRVGDRTVSTLPGRGGLALGMDRTSIVLTAMIVAVDALPGRS